MSAVDYAQRVEAIRGRAGFWRVEHGGKVRMVMFAPPVDLAGVRRFYPGANGEPLEPEAFMAEIREGAPDGKPAKA